MPFALNAFYRKTSTRRGQLPVGTIVKCLFAGQGGGLLAQYVDGDVVADPYFESNENFQQYEVFVPPITRTFYFIVAQRVIAPRNNETDILSHVVGKTPGIRNIDEAREAFLRSNRNHVIIHIAEFSHTIDNTPNVGDLVDDF